MSTETLPARTPSDRTLATIEAAPAVGLIDTDLSIVLRGLPPREPATVRARVEVPGRSVWESSIIVVADSAGEVDLATTVPVLGSYRIADPNGLLWSLTPIEGTDEAAQNSRFLDTALAPYDLVLTVESAGEFVATTTVVRLPVAPDVLRREVREDGLVATIFTPAEPGPHPTIVVVPGSDGGIPEHPAALFASHGYTALALAYYRAGDPGELPETLTEIPLEYFERALAWLSRHPAVDADRIAISGTSRGGELALLLASRYPFAAVVAWVPSNYLHPAIGPDAGEQRASWTVGGRPLPFIDRREGESGPEFPVQNGALVSSISHLTNLAGHPLRSEAEIPVERIGGPVLFVSGRDDLLWPSATFSDWAVERLEANDFAHEVVHLSYPNAGHTVGPAGSPASIHLLHWVAPGTTREQATTFDLGGTTEGIALARADLWPKVLSFLARSLR